eukprot:TRINITY_DN17333_c0_g1_i4.p1 TRINITY_DN17333_c0_g1~~TRINITY_DN17333_c0_g1_i4.p1  ORF type:complete len:545 (-),score=76.63 TRINITY_DN17333_c0_g1_i4:756-2390(-)
MANNQNFKCVIRSLGDPSQGRDRQMMFAFDQQKEEIENTADANSGGPLMSVLSNEGLVLQGVLPETTRAALGYTGEMEGMSIHAYAVQQQQQQQPHASVPEKNSSQEGDDLDVMKNEVLASLNQKQKFLNRENSDQTAVHFFDSSRRLTEDANAFSFISSEFERQIQCSVDCQGQTQGATVAAAQTVTLGQRVVDQQQEQLGESDSTIIKNVKTDNSNRIRFDTRILWRLQSNKEGNKTQVPLVNSKSPYREGTSFDIDWENDITFHEKGFLGEGTFGKVFRGSWQGQEVVAKVFKPEFQNEVDKRTMKIFETELEIMCRVQHDNIVQCYGGCKRQAKRALVMEYMDKGSLDTYIHKKRQSMKLIHYFKIIKSVSKALNYLHPTIVHLDIKPQNILLNSKGMVKVADFGLSRFKETSALSSSCNMGTAQYIAPEMLTGTHRPTFKLDIYALGILMWEMYTGNRPWEGFLECQIAYQVMQGERPQIPPGCPEDIRDMMSQCWDADPKVRPTANQIYLWCKKMIQIEDKRETPIILQRSQRKKQQR